jgi:hypothetical protein
MSQSQVSLARRMTSLSVYVLGQLNHAIIGYLPPLYLIEGYFALCRMRSQDSQVRGGMKDDFPFSTKYKDRER